MVISRMINFDPKKRPSAFELLEDPFLLEHAQVDIKGNIQH